MVGIFDKEYKKLNKEQRKAVDTIEGPVIVIAGPGTGKTQILTLRIANILKKAGAGIGPENILALTFTNAGVVAMRERLASFIGPEEAYRTNIYTFHSFCEAQINQYPDYFPTLVFARVASDVERIHIVEHILQNTEFELLKTFGSDFHYTQSILSAIDQLKREGITPDMFAQKIIAQEENILADENSYYKRNTKNNKKGDLKTALLKPIEKNKELQIVYKFYQEALSEKKLYDFTDMIMQFISVAENDDEFASLLQEQYLYILVDEHQDTNDGQNRIIDILTSAPHLENNPNIFTVGDDKQAIYRFQGASVKNFLYFKEKFPQATVITLENNYRSAQGILDHAHTLITAGDKKKRHRELIAHKRKKADVVVRHFPTYRDELVWIAEDIAEKIDSGIEPDDIAVFYRENNNLEFIKEVFEKKNISFVVTSRQNVLDDVHIQKLLLLLRLINDPTNSAILAEVLFVDFVPIHVTQALRILDAFAVLSRTMTLYAFIADHKQLYEYDIERIEEIDAFVQFIDTHVENAHNMHFLEFFEQFVQKSGFLSSIFAQDDHIFLLRKLERLFDEIRECTINQKNYNLAQFIKHLDALEKYNISLDVARNRQKGGVNLMTAHGSKGLEFTHVYITHVVDGLWGGKRKNVQFSLPIDTVKGDMEDERRLFYVAVTRTKDTLTISYADYDISGRERMPSLFIQDLKARCIDMKSNERDVITTFFAPRLLEVSSLISLDYIREKFLTTQLSATALNNYFDSPLLYFFRNLVRLPSVQNKTMLYGSVLHAALERFFAQSCTQGHILSKSELIDAFFYVIDVMHIPAEYYESIKKRGKKALSGYYDAHRDTFTVNVVLEKKIKGIPFLLDNGEEILLSGVIDKIEFLQDKTVRVVDYKSGKPWSRNTREKETALKRQIFFYKILLDAYNDGEYRMQEGMLDFIEPHPQSGIFERKLMYVTTTDMTQIKEEINHFAQDILSGAFLETILEKKYNDATQKELLALLQIIKDNEKNK